MRERINDLYGTVESLTTALQALRGAVGLDVGDLHLAVSPNDLVDGRPRGRT